MTPNPTESPSPARKSLEELAREAAESNAVRRGFTLSDPEAYEVILTALRDATESTNSAFVAADEARKAWADRAIAAKSEIESLRLAVAQQEDTKIRNEASDDAYAEVRQLLNYVFYQRLPGGDKVEEYVPAEWWNRVVAALKYPTLRAAIADAMKGEK